MNMVERVARAICRAHGKWIEDESWHTYQDEARAAIEAMREPTMEMRNGVRPQEYTIKHYHGSGHHRSFPTLGSGPVQIWQDMIDAALSE